MRPVYRFVAIVMLCASVWLCGQPLAFAQPKTLPKSCPSERMWWDCEQAKRGKFTSVELGGNGAAFQSVLTAFVRLAHNLLQGGLMQLVQNLK